MDSEAGEKKAMKLWESRKSRMNRAASELESSFNEFLKRGNETRGFMVRILDDPNSKVFFDKNKARVIEEGRKRIQDLRNSEDTHQADFALVQYGDLCNLDWLMDVIEGVNIRITQHREFMLRVLDAIAERSDQKVVKLRDELKKEIEAKGMSPEKEAIVNALVEHFLSEADRAKRDAEQAKKDDSHAGK